MAVPTGDLAAELCSEVAARMGGTWGRALPIQMAGKDFGDTILPTEPKKAKPGWSVRSDQRKRRARRQNRWWI